MKTLIDRRTLLGGLALALGASLVRADDGDRDDDDHDEARRALEEGQVRPYADILAQVEHQIEGEVVGVEFERRDGRYVYEFKVVTSSGRLSEVLVDAASAEILTAAGE